MKKEKFFSAYYFYGVIALWAIGCFAFFQLCLPYHFFFKEQNQLFLLSADYVATYLERPAWMACLVGDFLTQFYYYLYAGAALLTLVLLTLGDAVRRSLQRAGMNRHVAFWFAMLTMAFEAVAHFSVHYQLSSTIALIGGVVVYFVVSFVLRRSWWLSLLALVVATAACYWLFGLGLWALFCLLLIDAICHWRQRSGHVALTGWLIPLLAIGVIALVSRSHLNMKAADALTYPGMAKLGMPNWLLEKDFAVDNEYHFGNYDRVVSMVEKSDVRTQEMLFFYNLVMAQRGQLPDALMRFRPNQLGTFYRIGPQTPLITIRNMNELYWVVGDMTFTERAAMMTNVFSKHNRNVRMMQRLAECNVVSGDSAAAEKYLRLLDQTLVYRRWAQRVRANGDNIYKEKRKFCNHHDTITVTDNMHFMLMQLLDHDAQNGVALDYLLCSDLLLKDIESFKRDYDRYCTGEHARPAARLYQEALCIWLAGTHADEEQWQRYISSQEVVRRFAEYNERRGSTAFEGTYWYYFDKAKPPKVEM